MPFYRPHPGHKAGSDGFAFQPAKGPAAHIMFGDAVFQGEELSQPPFLGFSVFFDVFPPFGKGHDGQQGDNDNFYQRRLSQNFSFWESLLRFKG
jgi:hypothetical protein